jgi:hypothetical protein
MTSCCLQEHHAGHVVAPQEVAGRDWRRKLAYRATDRAVRERTGLTPLSVAADRIGLTAMRAAGILSRWRRKAARLTVLGNGIVVEVYPAASPRCWGLPFRAYKGGKRRAAREALIGESMTARAFDSPCSSEHRGLTFEPMPTCALTPTMPWTL